MSRSPRIISAFVVLTMLLLLGACAATSGTPSETAAVATGSAGVPSATGPLTASNAPTTGASRATRVLLPPTDPSTFASPTDERTPSPVPVPTRVGAGGQLTVVGTVEDGAEPSCLILTDESTGEHFNVTGGDRAIVKIGARIKVVGVIRTDLMSHCQQGKILEVLKATTA